MQLNSFFRDHPKVAVAFSGGTDSAFLLYEAKVCGAEVCAYYVKTAFQPAFELQDARRLADTLGVRLEVLDADILSDPQITDNPGNRCYFCKKKLFGILTEAAAKDGFPVLLDGTNASDDEGDRPGMRALRELSVRSPLRECGLTKEQIRKLSKEAGLFTWDKPAYACLATRIPTGTPITEKALHDTEQAETLLFSLGFRDFRVRMYHGAARIQVREEALPLILTHRETILTELKKRYPAILLDLEVRA